jgi:hypothetical protein
LLRLPERQRRPDSALLLVLVQRDCGDRSRADCCSLSERKSVDGGQTPRRSSGGALGASACGAHWGTLV